MQQQEVIGTGKTIETKEHNRPWFVLAMLAIGVVLSALDLTVVVAILTTMMNDLNVPITDIDDGAWIVSAYLLAYTVTIPFMGRVSDVFGRRGVFLGALAIFVIGSIMAALAKDLGWMIAARTIQALGGGAMVPVAMATAGDLFPPQKRGLAIGIIGAADTAGWVFGPLYGSLMLKFFGWQSIFWINLPLGIISGALIFFALKSQSHPSPTTNSTRVIKPARSNKKFGQIDFLGFLFLAIALTCVSLALGGGRDTAALGGASLDQLSENPLAQFQIPLLIGAAVALVIFVIVELRVDFPLLNVRTFRKVTYTLANIVNFIVGGALVTSLVAIALFVNATNRSLDLVDVAFNSAFALAPLTIGMAVGAIIGGWLSDRAGYALVTIFGLLLVIGGFLLMNTWQTSYRMPDDIFLLFPGGGLAGLGFGLIIAPVGSAVIDWAEQTDIGVAAGLVLIMRLVGMTVGVSLMTSWALSRYDQLKPKQVDLTQISADSLRRPIAQVVIELFLYLAIITAIAIIPALFLRRPKSAQTDAPAREIGRLL
jgi:EmrB/QacA subfamily drug resistance transporter